MAGANGVGQAMFIGMNGTSLFGGGYADDLRYDKFWQPGVWHHVCVTYDGTTARLYADGKLVASQVKDWRLVLNRAHIGRQVNDSAEFWDGAVDDVCIYRRAIAAGEVKDIMESWPVPNLSF